MVLPNAFENCKETKIWSRRDLNPRPSKCESDALPAELRPLVSNKAAGQKQRLFPIGRLQCIVDRKKEIKDFPLF